MRQLWRHLGFLHWPVGPRVVAALLPPGLTVDTFGGAAYLGIVPFTIPWSRMPRPGIPVAPSFHELNLRTYVRGPSGSPGVWFFSLDAASRLAVMGARLAYHLPYFHARMAMSVTDGGPEPMVTYQANRRCRRAPSAEFHARYWPTGPAAPAAAGTIESFLVERYLLYAWTGRVLLEARVHHDPYRLRPASVADLDESLLSAAGLPAAIGAPAYMHYVGEVDVRIERPYRLGRSP